MIVGNLKPLKEIIESLGDYKNIFVLGCGGCVSVCLTGGDRQAHELATELDHIRHYKTGKPKFTVHTIERQCEPDWLKDYLTIPENTDAVLSLACGAGVQTMAFFFESLPVIPAVNTTFMGSNVEPGVWQEMCRGCGDCLLGHTGGICPVARCAKTLFNGPCGGSSNGSCEVDKNTVCAWAMIYYKLKKTGQLHRLMKVREPKNWQPAGGAGPRKLVRPFNKPL
jgi:ferredoxin